MAQKIAIKTEETKPAEPSTAARQVQPMKTGALEWQVEGFRWRVAEVRLPLGVIVQDLHDYAHVLWKNIQGDRNKVLRRFDTVRCISGNESFVIREALVIDADAEQVVLSIRPNDIIALPSRGETWEDKDVKIFFDGPAKFVVDRKNGGARLLSGYHTLEAARAAYYASQPKQVA